MKDECMSASSAQFAESASVPTTGTREAEIPDELPEELPVSREKASRANPAAGLLGFPAFCSELKEMRKRPNYIRVFLEYLPAKLGSWKGKKNVHRLRWKFARKRGLSTFRQPFSRSLIRASFASRLAASSTSREVHFEIRPSRTDVEFVSSYFVTS